MVFDQIRDPGIPIVLRPLLLFYVHKIKKIVLIYWEVVKLIKTMLEIQKTYDFCFGYFLLFLEKMMEVSVFLNSGIVTPINEFRLLSSNYNILTRLRHVGFNRR